MEECYFNTKLLNLKKNTYGSETENEYAKYGSEYEKSSCIYKKSLNTNYINYEQPMYLIQIMYKVCILHHFHILYF